MQALSSLMQGNRAAELAPTESLDASLVVSLDTSLLTSSPAPVHAVTTHEAAKEAPVTVTLDSGSDTEAGVSQPDKAVPQETALPTPSPQIEAGGSEQSKVLRSPTVVVVLGLPGR